MQEIEPGIQVLVKKKQGQIIVSELPIIQGYKSELYSLFQNMITHALKYAHPYIPSHYRNSL